MNNSKAIFAKASTMTGKLATQTKVIANAIASQEKSDVKIAVALKNISDNELYVLDGFSSFNAYCDEVLGLNKGIVKTFLFLTHFLAEDGKGLSEYWDGFGKTALYEIGAIARAEKLANTADIVARSREFCDQQGITFETSCSRIRFLVDKALGKNNGKSEDNAGNGNGKDADNGADNGKNKPVDVSGAVADYIRSLEVLKAALDGDALNELVKLHKAVVKLVPEIKEQTSKKK